MKRARHGRGSQHGRAGRRCGRQRQPRRPARGPRRVAYRGRSRRQSRRPGSAPSSGPRARRPVRGPRPGMRRSPPWACAAPRSRQRQFVLDPVTPQHCANGSCWAARCCAGRSRRGAHRHPPDHAPRSKDSATCTTRNTGMVQQATAPQRTPSLRGRDNSQPASACDNACDDVVVPDDTVKRRGHGAWSRRYRAGRRCHHAAAPAEQATASLSSSRGSFAIEPTCRRAIANVFSSSVGQASRARSSPRHTLSAQHWPITSAWPRFDSSSRPKQPSQSRLSEQSQRDTSSSVARRDDVYVGPRDPGRLATLLAIDLDGVEHA